LDFNVAETAASFESIEALKQLPVTPSADPDDELKRARFMEALAGVQAAIARGTADSLDFSGIVA